MTESENKKRYIVTGCRKVTPPSYYRIRQACEMLQKYDGLSKYYSILEVIDLWEVYSETMSAGWLFDYPEEIAEVFGVTIEEYEMPKTDWTKK